ncbi:hypothetical protein BH11PLA1_BH11PLA1_19670 [soil metagenome]
MTKRSSTVALISLAAGALALGGCWKPTSYYDQQRDATLSEIQAGDNFVLAAEAAIRAGDRPRALAEFGRAIEVNPRLTSAHLGMADVYRIDGDYTRAEQGYKRAADIEPRNFDAQYYDGLMLHVLNRVVDAVQAYLRALAVRPEDFNANLNIGAAYFQLNEFVQALPYASKAARLDPKNGAARFSLGAIYAGLGRHQEAIAEYEQALDNNAEMPGGQLLLNLSTSYGALGRYEEMRNTLDRLVRSAPTPAAYERLGFAHFRSGDIPAAIASYQQSLRLDPDYYPALNGVGVCELNNYLWSDRNDIPARDRAFTVLRRSLVLNRNQPKVQDLLTRYNQ